MLKRLYALKRIIKYSVQVRIMSNWKGPAVSHLIFPKLSVPDHPPLKKCQSFKFPQCENRINRDMVRKKVKSKSQSLQAANAIHVANLLASKLTIHTIRYTIKLHSRGEATEYVSAVKQRRMMLSGQKKRR